MSSEISTIRNRQYRTDETGTQWTRKMRRDGTWPESWAMVQVEPKDSLSVDQTAARESHDPFYLYVIMQLQSEGEPMHWCLFVARETGPGTVYQVTGDATFMHYAHEVNSNKRESESFYNAYQLCELKNGEEDSTSMRLIELYANSVTPPQAENRAAVRENCQGWVIRVLRALQGVGVVDEGTVDGMEALVQPIT